MSQREYSEWSSRYRKAQGSILNKEKKIEECHDLLERDFDLVGATAIEDRLQDDVAETISAIKEANINFWMLTGDKIETAINIGFSCKLLSQSY